ncbi:hypothetical protein ACSAZK_17255 [Methanosarcina sp. Mfa9]|uniref:hypothetical protein n=1 Tax=Methanosarcina sp. Mfa9 TaxID=3439063 RepID=UPI003F82EC69
MAKEDSVKWSEVKNSLKTLDKKELIDLIRDLYRHSTENRRIIISRQPEEKKSDWVLESFQQVIRNEFLSDNDFGGLRSDVARKAILDYSEGSGDLAGTMELMILFLENVVEFIKEYGDIDEEFYDAGYEMLRKFSELLKTPEGQGFYPQFKERLFKLRRESDDFGYGFGDDIASYVEDVEDFFEEDQQ